MELDLLWKSALIVIVGTALLRIAGRKSISQMTMAQTVIMIAIGSMLIEPVTGKNIWVAFGVGIILVLTLVIMEILQFKGDGFEKLITGKAKILIENGVLHEKNFAKLRITIDQLEMQLRQKNVTKIRDVQWATLEPNGQVGFLLKEDSQSVTKKDFNKLMNAVENLQQTLNTLHPNLSQSFKNNNEFTYPANQENLFTEIKHKEQQMIIPKHLQ